MIKAKHILVHRVEGYAHECVPVTTTGSRPWDEANAHLLRMSATAPKDGTYDKTDFTVTYEDGETHEGRYDLKPHSVEVPDLAKHVRDFLQFYAGLRKPAHMTQERYDAFLAQPSTRKHHEECKAFLETYEIGTPEAAAVATGADPFVFTNEPPAQPEPAPTAVDTGGWTLIHGYSRAQALADGVLVDLRQKPSTDKPDALDLDEVCRNAGIKVPLACTARVWAECIEVTPAAREMCCDVKGAPLGHPRDVPARAPQARCARGVGGRVRRARRARQARADGDDAQDDRRARRRRRARAHPGIPGGRLT